MNTESITHFIGYFFIASIAAYYLSKIYRCPKNIDTKIYSFLEIVLWKYLPLFLSIIVFVYFLSQKDAIVNHIPFSKKLSNKIQDNGIMFNSYCFMLSSTTLIAASAFFYLHDIVRVFPKLTQKSNMLHYIAALFCFFTAISNSIFCFAIYKDVFINYSFLSSDEYLKYYELISIASMVTYLLIDSLIYLSFKRSISIDKNAAGQLKTCIFAIWNVDMASLFALIFLQFLDETYLKVGDTFYNYIFITSGIAVQAILTQFAFSSYQAKKSIDKLYL